MAANEDRNSQIGKLGNTDFDCLIVGGGATGAGTALDCTLRGLKTILIERKDFASGTSSRSTKLIHGGVRYLAQFHFGLIAEALSERKRLLQNAPHLVKPLKFVMPTYAYFEKPYYSLGLTLYDFLAGGSNLPSHKRISREEIIGEFPGINTVELKGGISYYDAQFNDARLNIMLARCTAKEGGIVCNKVALESLTKTNGKISGAVLKDEISGKTIHVRSKTVVNATGVFIDEVRKMDDPDSAPVLSPSQGIHLVFSKEKIECKSAMIIPKTSDGRVVFLIPWENHVVMGTTDTPVNKISKEPIPIDSEVEFLLKTGNEYLSKKLEKKDIQSVYAGLRPLISIDGNADTKNISREEMILVSPSGLITMSGGKWSTYRKMAEDLTDRVIKEGELNPANKCSTYNYPFIGATGFSEKLWIEIQKIYSVNEETAKRLQDYYGTEVFDVLGKCPSEITSQKDYYKEEVLFAIRNEFALSVLDILARRFRVLFTNLKLAKRLVKPIAEIMQMELGWDQKQTKESENEADNLIKDLQDSIL